jgi:Saxitoxin biosynthesis operon protein SxtJ
MKKEPIPTERSFGILVSIVLLSIAGYRHLKNSLGDVPMLERELLLLALTVFGVAMVMPRLLRPFNMAWYQFGNLLSRLANPIVLGAIFFLLITPIAIFGKLIGRDELRLKKRQTSSYWILRDPENQKPASFKYQF